MPNLMDSAPFVSSTPLNSVSQQESLIETVRRAKQDPLGFEEMVKRTNPEGYQRAMQIRNCANPKAMVMEMAKAQGINPNILDILGLH